MSNSAVVPALEAEENSTFTTEEEPKKVAEAAGPKQAKKSKKPKAPKKPKALKKPKSHPPITHMIMDAVKTLNKRRGSSISAIKAFIADKYKVDVKKLAPFIKKVLKRAVAKGELIAE